MAKTRRTSSHETASGFFAEAAESRYPVNEVMLKTLVHLGKTGVEIASLCRTTPATVAHMREAYGI